MKFPEPNRTSCTIDTVTHTAENDPLDRRDFFLSDQDFEAFKKMLDASPKKISTLITLLSEKAPWER